jgi:hypothetical protein
MIPSGDHCERRLDGAAIPERRERPPALAERRRGGAVIPSGASDCGGDHCER